MSRTHTVGLRLREMRLDRGVRQADLAQRAGISASYLNLIEHDRRRVGGRLLRDLAQALEVEPSDLSAENDAMLTARLTALACAAGADAQSEQAAALVARFPGWAALITEQAAQIEALEAKLAAMSDRMAHDPGLASALHEVLSAITSIRSTSSILAQGDDLDDDWQRRFQRNLYQDAQRLTESSAKLTEVIRGPAEEAALSPEEEADRFFAAQNWFFPTLENGGAIADVLAASPVSDDAQHFVISRLNQYVKDAEALPLDAFASAAKAVDYDPLSLAAKTGGNLALVLRRLACLPEGQGHPRTGLAICNNAGQITARKPVEDVVVPRSGQRCAHWPIFTALTRPGQPVYHNVILPRQGGVRLRAWAIAVVGLPATPHTPPTVEATMLLRPDAGPAKPDDVPVGDDCPICVSIS